MTRPGVGAFTVALVLGFAFGPVPQSSQAGAAEPFTPPDCGLNCLYALLKLNGNEVDLQTLESALPPRNAQGYSLAELQAAASTFGMRLEGRQVGPSDTPFDRPVIAHIGFGETRSGHYVVLVPVGRTGTMTQMFDPPYHPHITDYTKLFVANRGSMRILRPVYDGETLIRAFALFATVACLLAVVGALTLSRRCGKSAWPSRNTPRM
jgi:hypothetical protein